jgi:hypothetical protein
LCGCVSLVVLSLPDVFLWGFCILSLFFVVLLFVFAFILVLSDWFSGGSVSVPLRWDWRR